MSKRTKTQDHHTEHLLQLLLAPMGTWVNGKTLTEEVGTAQLPARIAALRAVGWIVEARPSKVNDFHEYRITGRGLPPGRHQLKLKLPLHPERRGWTDHEVAALHKKLLPHLTTIIAEDYPVAPAEPDFFAGLFGEDEK